MKDSLTSSKATAARLTLQLRALEEQYDALLAEKQSVSEKLASYIAKWKKFQEVVLTSTPSKDIVSVRKRKNRLKIRALHAGLDLEPEVGGSGNDLMHTPTRRDSPRSSTASSPKSPTRSSRAPRSMLSLPPLERSPAKSLMSFLKAEPTDDTSSKLDVFGSRPAGTPESVPITSIETSRTGTENQPEPTGVLIEAVGERATSVTEPLLGPYSGNPSPSRPTRKLKSNIAC
jgi:hypothetical protein